MPWTAVMHKFDKGTLKSGGSGKKVTSRKQAVAIMLSEKRAAPHKPEYAAKPESHSFNWRSRAGLKRGAR